MESAIDPMVLGPLMIILTSLWFAAMSWSGMREEDSAPVRAHGPGPWWANDCFTGARHTAEAAQPGR